VSRRSNYRTIRQPTKLARFRLRIARHHMFFSDAKARRDLGCTSRPYRNAIADAIAWFKQAGYVR
jgi:nucleoside-diphosphate-sugar epimerase